VCVCVCYVILDVCVKFILMVIMSYESVTQLCQYDTPHLFCSSDCQSSTVSRLCPEACWGQRGKEGVTVRGVYPSALAMKSRVRGICVRASSVVIVQLLTVPVHRTSGCSN